MVKRGTESAHHKTRPVSPPIIVLRARESATWASSTLPTRVDSRRGVKNVWRRAHLMRCGLELRRRFGGVWSVAVQSPLLCSSRLSSCAPHACRAARRSLYHPSWAPVRAVSEEGGCAALLLTRLPPLCSLPFFRARDEPLCGERPTACSLSQENVKRTEGRDRGWTEESCSVALLRPHSAHRDLTRQHDSQGPKQLL